MENFLQLRATSKLQELAKVPLDLTKNLTAARVSKFKATSAGFTCLFATERVTDEVVEALTLLAQEAKVIDQMAKLQSGEVVNFIEGYASENRPALHTALRDFFDQPQT